MNDFYSEHLVKKRREGKETALKILMILLTVICFLFNLFIPFGIVLVCILIVVDVVLFRRMDIEYEYMYLNGELDIDMVIHKERRKKLCSIQMEDVVIAAPSGSDKLAGYQRIAVTDYSSRNADAQTFEIVCNISGEKRRIRLEPKKEMIEDMWMRSPRKVIRTDG